MQRHLYVGLVWALLAAGLIVRSWGVLVDTLDLWADEAWWAMLLESRGLDEHGFRPIGYMWLCRELLALGDPEFVLRLPSYLGGLGALLFIWKSAELLYRNRIAVIFVLLVAVVHPNLIAFAKEFKPYSLEVFAYSMLTYLALQAMRRARTGVGLPVAALSVAPFSYPVVFLYPALVTVFAGRRLAGLARLPAPTLALLVTGALAALFFLHLYLSDLLQVPQLRLLWGVKYGVFPIDTGIVGGFAWYAQKTWSLLVLPGALHGVHPALQSISGLAYLGGLVALLAARRYREVILLCMPLAAAALANLLGYWPYGAFRANLFLIPGALLVIGHAIDWLAAGRRTRIAAYGLLAGVAVAAGAAGSAVYRTKLVAHWAAAPQLTAVLDELDARLPERPDSWPDVVLADWHSWRVLSYYLREYPGLSERIRLVRGPLADTAALESQIAREIERARRAGRGTRLWVVVTNLDPHDAIRASPVVKQHLAGEREFHTQDVDYHPLLIELRIPAQSGADGEI